MNQWKRIWESKGDGFQKREDVFEMFCELKRANGFDVQVDEEYYRNFWLQWKEMEKNIRRLCGSYESVYEAGCGSGVNLYLFRELCGIRELGGCDYSQSLLKVAESILPQTELLCREAAELEAEPKYDVVLSESVFQYFYDADYGMRVLEKMYAKAKKLIVVTEIHDIDKKEALLARRRAAVENYDELYKGLDKTFYSKGAFEAFAKERGAAVEFVNPKNDSYWNNDYVFDCYIHLGER